MRTLISNIRRLWQIRENTPAPIRGTDMAVLPCLENAWLLLEDATIHSYGSGEAPVADHIVNAHQGDVLPAWCDSHTHIVFAADRSSEFLMKLKGASYEEIAAKGGGILNSAKKVQEADENLLFELACARLDALRAQGTGAIEIKSGYGLTLDAELKMLRVIKRMKERYDMPIKATFLGAHAYPTAYKNDHEAYIKILIDEMLPRIADEGLADYIDAFCEQGFFSNEETARILEAGNQYGLKPKVHVNQLSNSGALQTAVAHGALTVDHLEQIGEAEIACLKDSNTLATLLPSCSFFLRIPYAPARALIDAGLAVVLASDFNPGSTPSGNIPFLISLACIYQRMLPEEAINAITINGAFAMEVEKSSGSITVGKRADFIITKAIPGLEYIPYAFGTNHIEEVWLGGKKE
jgi:imidazolonepropionase